MKKNVKLSNTKPSTAEEEPPSWAQDLLDQISGIWEPFQQKFDDLHNSVLPLLTVSSVYDVLGPGRLLHHDQFVSLKNLQNMLLSGVFFCSGGI